MQSLNPEKVKKILQLINLDLNSIVKDNYYTDGKANYYHTEMNALVENYSEKIRYTECRIHILPKNNRDVEYAYPRAGTVEMRICSKKRN